MNEEDKTLVNGVGKGIAIPKLDDMDYGLYTLLMREKDHFKYFAHLNFDKNIANRLTGAVHYMMCFMAKLSKSEGTLDYTILREIRLAREILVQIQEEVDEFYELKSEADYNE